MKLITYFTYITLLIFLASCTETKQDLTIRILQTTDIHGCIFPYDFINQKEINNSLAHVYSYVEKIRESNPESVILLDNGDFLQGQPTVYYYNFEDVASQHLGAQVFNYMQYDAATVGNHDIETGHEVYDRFREQLNAPYLAANAIKQDGAPYFEPYTIIERQGIKVAILGLITPGIPNWLPENLWEGIQFTDMVESASKWVKIINEKHKPDLLIGMFHSGIDHTYGNEKGSEYMNENATKLVAEQVAGFDIVLAGHDHQFHNKTIANHEGDSVVLLDPKSHARYVSDITIDFAYNKKTQSYDKTIKTDITDVQTMKPSKDFLIKFEKEYDEVKAFVNKNIGELSINLSTKNAYFESTPFVNLIHQVQLDNSEAEISFTAPLSFNTTVPKGPIQISDLFKLYKYENMLYTMKLTGEEIDIFLEYSYGQWFNQMQHPNDHILKMKPDHDGLIKLEAKYYNLSTAYGIEYIVNLEKASGDKINIIGKSDGNPFFMDSTYLIAVNSYRGNGGGGHFTEGLGLSKEEIKNRLVHASDKDLRYYLMQWIEDKKIIKPSHRKNWKCIPEDYFEKGKQKDYPLLFPKK